MGKLSATCEYVQDGDTFRTAMKNWIRLARYDAPEEGKPNFERRKQEQKQDYPNSIIRKVGGKVTEKTAREWERDEGFT